MQWLLRNSLKLPVAIFPIAIIDRIAVVNCHITIAYCHIDIACLSLHKVTSRATVMMSIVKHTSSVHINTLKDYYMMFAMQQCKAAVGRECRRVLVWQRTSFHWVIIKDETTIN